MTAIIDYGAGNIRSVQNALTILGEESILTKDPERILSAEHIILPGVGAFGDAMAAICALSLEEVIREAVRREIPFLGVCLGLQLLFEESEESPGVKGLGLLPGKILRIPEGEGRKIPQIGWNDLTYPSAGRLFEGVPEHSYVYFVHSYYLRAQEPEIVKARTGYGVEIDASVEKGNLFACQFHPEKSAAPGLKMLENFLRIGRS